MRACGTQEESGRKTEAPQAAPCRGQAFAHKELEQPGCCMMVENGRVRCFQATEQIVAAIGYVKLHPYEARDGRCTRRCSSEKSSWEKEVLKMTALGQSGFASSLPVEEACALAMAGVGNIGVAGGADCEA